MYVHMLYDQKEPDRYLIIIIEIEKIEIEIEICMF